MMVNVAFELNEGRVNASSYKLKASRGRDLRRGAENAGEKSCEHEPYVMIVSDADWLMCNEE